jgi:hypothetical protein
MSPSKAFAANDLAILVIPKALPFLYASELSVFGMQRVKYWQYSQNNQLTAFGLIRQQAQNTPSLLAL